MRTPQGDSLRRGFFESAMEPARAAMGRGDSIEAFRRLTDAVTGVPGRFDRLPDGARASLFAQAGAMRRALLADPRVFSPPLACGALGRIASPVLLLRGDRSPRMFHLIVEELARCLNSETTILVPGAGHRMERDNPAFYDQTVLRFLSDH
jgi:pimeloyl-ACP methyl ester carboxylesterase